jgi:Family of unknown function (DUF6600)/FecR protein
MRVLMTKLSLQRFGTMASILLLLLLAPPQSARAQDQDIDQTVARISFVSGSVSYSRGDDPDDWDDAIVNVPLTLGDKIYAPENGRAELQLPGGNFVRVGHRTYFTALNLTYDTKQFYLGEGAAAFNIRRLGSDEVFEVDTPNVAVTFDGPGKYRLEVDSNGDTRILVRRGRVVVAANGRQITAQEGEIHVYGIDSPRYEMVALRSPDAFDSWVDERDGRFDRGYADARRYASDEVVGIEDLRDYGRWEDIPEYGRAWTPDRVAVGWRPYTVGHWFWQDPWGWTWISEEPWGWAPSHYGRWTSYRSRWYWVPVAPRVRVRYAPAVVAFVRDRDDVGWFPLAPRDRFIPWWGRQRERRNIENITYVNRNYITVVNQNTFISSRNVSNNIVRDSVIVRETNSVRVMEQPLPIPNRSSLRVRGEREDRKVQRPPETVVSRPAVVRTAPVPPPPTFQEKLPEIQKAKGEPVAPDKAQTMGLANLKASNRRNPIRPAAVESGRGDFAPRTPSASAPAAQPLTAPRGKKLATAEDPVVTNAPQRPERSERPASKPDQGVKTPSEPSKESARLPEGQQQQDRGPQKRGKQPQDQQQLREEQKARDLERQQLQEQERQKQETRLQQQPQKQAPQARKEPQREEQKSRDLERQQLQEQERQKQETRLQKQPQKEAPQVRKEPQREAPGREQVERRQPQKQERDLQQTKSQPPEPRKETQRERKKPQEEETKGGTSGPDRS